MRNILCNVQKVFERVGATYLLTIHVGHHHGRESGKFSGYPQAWCVVDDFGTLVMVEELT